MGLESRDKNSLANRRRSLLFIPVKLAWMQDSMIQ